MLDDLEKEFDLKIRSMMENGREEVPDRVWESVNDRLQEIHAGKNRKRMPAWMRNTGIGFAAAAAVAVAVVSGIRQEPVPDSSVIAVVSPAPEDMEETGRTAASSLIAAAAAPAETSKAEQPSSMPQSVLDTPAEISEESQDAQTGDSTSEESLTGAAAESSPEKGTVTGVSAGKSAGENSSYSLPDPAADFAADFPDDEAKKKRPDVSLAMFGNAISNRTSDGNGGAIPPMQSQGRGIRNEIVENSTTSYGIPMSFGVGARIGFTRRWSMSIGVNYTLLTRTFDGTYYDAEGTAFTDSDIRNSQHYIGIPVNVYCSIYKGSFVDFYAYAGGTVEKCVADRYLIDATDRVISHSENSQGVQLSANAGIGVEFIVGNRLGIYIDPSVRYYFESRQPNSIRKVQPLMLGFEAGLRVRL